MPLAQARAARLGRGLWSCLQLTGFAKEVLTGSQDRYGEEGRRGGRSRVCSRPFARSAQARQRSARCHS